MTARDTPAFPLVNIVFCHYLKGHVTTCVTAMFSLVNKFLSIKLLLAVLILVSLTWEGTGHNSGIARPSCVTLRS